MRWLVEQAWGKKLTAALLLDIMLTLAVSGNLSSQ
jgi:hypothetical protein